MSKSDRWRKITRARPCVGDTMILWIPKMNSASIGYRMNNDGFYSYDGQGTVRASHYMPLPEAPVTRKAALR